MKKKIVLLLLILLPISFLFFTNNAKADDVDRYVILWYYKTEKQEYYTDETIIINTSWSFNYAPNEVCYLRFEIFNETGNLLWNSIWYSDKYPYPSRFNVTHYVPIRDLYIPLNLSEYILHIRLFYVFDYGQSYIADVPITILKRNCTCELYNFKNNININTGTNGFNFTAKFYNETKILANQLIYVKINNISISKLTNINGSIELEIRFPNNLTLGNNILILNISNNKFISPRTFEYEIIVNSNSILNNISDKYSNKNDENKDSMLKFNAFSFSLIFFISIFIMLTIYYNNNNKIKQQKIADITFRN